MCSPFKSGVHRKRNKGAILGAVGSNEARKRLIVKSQRKKHNLKKNIGIFSALINSDNFIFLDHIIKCEPDALHAMNLYRLLTKNWTEYPNAYKICSKIPKRKVKRLQEILNDNRYSS